jgi:hypothetical protein
MLDLYSEHLHRIRQLHLSDIQPIGLGAFVPPPHCAVDTAGDAAESATAFRW